MISCSNYGQLTFITTLPKKLNENSGIVTLQESRIWVIADNGNPDIIYEVDFKGVLQNTLKVKNAKNKDWEDLTKDEKGNLYIGDFGNNANKRKHLVVYKVPNPIHEKGSKIEAEAIFFEYPEQKEFPPSKEEHLYDAEAFFYFKDALFVITKNRTNPFNGRALIYKIPAKKGKHKAKLVGEINTCQSPKNCQVTAADISPDGKTIALLGYGTLWIFTEFEMDNFSNGKMTTINLGVSTQLEALCFSDNTTLLLSDEKKGPTGRNLYSYKLN